jgi:hypothetical protein
MKTFTCRCETVVDIDISDNIDLDSDQSLLEALAEGNFLSIRCPNCASTIRPEMPVRVRSAVYGLDVLVLTELDRLSVYRGKAAVPSACEVLIGYPELFERVRMIKDGFDAQGIEVMKYYIQDKAEEQDPEADITVWYHGLSAGNLEFRIIGLKSGETGVIKLPRGSYDRALEEARSGGGKFKAMLSGPYRSLRKLGFLDGDE